MIKYNICFATGILAAAWINSAAATDRSPVVWHDREQVRTNVDRLFHDAVRAHPSPAQPTAGSKLAQLRAATPARVKFLANHLGHDISIARLVPNIPIIGMRATSTLMTYFDRRIRWTFGPTASVRESPAEHNWRRAEDALADLMHLPGITGLAVHHLENRVRAARGSERTPTVKELEAPDQAEFDEVFGPFLINNIGGPALDHFKSGDWRYEGIGAQILDP